MRAWLCLAMFAILLGELDFSNALSIDIAPGYQQVGHRSDACILQEARSGMLRFSHVCFCVVRSNARRAIVYICILHTAVCRPRSCCGIAAEVHI